MTARSRRVAVCGCALAALATTVLAGCGSGPKLYHVSGRVTFDGQPVPAGFVFFEPDAAKGNDGVGGFAEVKDGHYDTRNSGKGVIGGPHNVRLSGFDGKPCVFEGRPMPSGMTIFADYTIAIELPRQATTRDFDVPAKARVKLTRLPVRPNSPGRL
ncbi:MAG: hypothetical protein L0Z62_24495 [Gemmataceae bacterium]|nr:hypothetical protein [Gemmataceae bacterium]